MKGIIFQTHHVELIIAGRKTQTRRIHWDNARTYAVGERVYAKEKWAVGPYGVVYWSGKKDAGISWQSPIFMPQRASRVIIEITAAKKQRLLDLTECDAQAEGADSRDSYFSLWDSINPQTPATTNPVVRAYTFKVVEVRK